MSAALAAGLGGQSRCRCSLLPLGSSPPSRPPRCVLRVVPSGCPFPLLAGTPFHAVSPSDGVALAKVVMMRMSSDVPRDKVLQQAPRRAPFVEDCRVRTNGAGSEGYSVEMRGRAQVSVSVQRLLAWLLHVVPRATLPWVTDLSVHLPPRALRQGGQYTLQVLYCDVLLCQAAEAKPRFKNACVVTPCERGRSPHWDLYALYDTVALYVPREFTVPELRLFG